MNLMNRFLTYFILVFVLIFSVSTVYHKTQRSKHDSFKLGCMTQGISKELCNVEAAEYIK